MTFFEEGGFPGARTRWLSAEVCINGHLTTGMLEYEPQRSAKHCQRCGAETIRTCPKCGVPIRGNYEGDGTVGYNHRSPWKHCHDCGAPFPWITGKLAAAKEYVAELDGLDETEKTQLQGAIEDLATDGHRTELAASRFKRLMGKVGPAVGSGLYKIALDVATEATKKLIM